MRLLRGFMPPRSLSRWLRRSVLASLAVTGVVAVTACGGGSSPKTSPSQNSNDLTVWVDAVRLPAAQAYVKAHPNVHVNVVTFDGDGNGATTLQTKIQLWNRTGNGWPDVVFSEQVNDPVWMAQKPFEFAAPVKGLISGRPAQPVAGAVDRPVHDQRHAVLRPGQPGPGRALGQQEADGPVRLHGSEDLAGVGGARAEGRHRAPRLHRRERRGLVQPLDLPVGQPVPAASSCRATSF